MAASKNWISCILDLEKQITEVETNDTRFLALHFLADYVVQYVEWWTTQFDEQLKVKPEEAAAVGRLLAAVLDMVLKLCNAEANPSKIEGESMMPSQGEFLECVNHLRTYTQMMNRLIRRLLPCPCHDKKLFILQRLQHKVEVDCSLLHEIIENGFEGHKSQPVLHRVALEDIHVTLSQLLAASASKYPENVALLASAGPSLTHAQLQAAVLQTGAKLRAAGLKPGKLVSLAFPNSIEFVVVFLAIARVRAVAAPLNSAYTEDEFHFYMEDAEATMLLVPGLEGNKNAEAAAERLKLPIAGVHWEKSNSGNDEGYVEVVPKSRLELTDEISPGPEPNQDDEALFLHTSGTTSRPKGVPLTQYNLASSIQHIVETYELSSIDKTVVVLPLFHVHGLMCSLLSSLAAGGTVVLPAAGRFSAGTFWNDMKHYGATWYTAVPTIHQIILARHKSKPEAEYPKLRFIRSCSASLAPAVLANLEESFCAPVLEAYAMTEASHQMTSNPLPSKGQRKPGSVGKPTGIELAILGDSGEKQPIGKEGEVCIRGPNVTKGYKNNPEANTKSFEFGWFHTGDRGFVDEDGYLHLTGRIKELINQGGEKISPLEIDAVLLAHPSVSEAVAFAAPDEKYGEVVNAAVVLHEGHSATEEDIINFCRKNLATFKLPRRLFFAKEVPRTPTGKIQRRIVAEHFLSQ